MVAGLCRIKGFKIHHGIRNFLDETVILFNQIIQILDLKYFNKTDQTGKHQQDVNMLQTGIVGPAFIHYNFFRKPVSVDDLLEESGGRRFIAEVVVRLEQGLGSSLGDQI
jgi:hypothetical protein